MIVRTDENEIILYTKGADSIVLSRCIRNNKHDSTDEILRNFGDDGLRTLVYAKKKLTEEEYQEWAQRYHVRYLSLKS